VNAILPTKIFMPYSLSELLFYIPARPGSVQ
jgi:hypothetical protein